MKKKHKLNIEYMQDDIEFQNRELSNLRNDNVLFKRLGCAFIGIVSIIIIALACLGLAKLLNL